jgi:hypothetical protein
VGAEFVWKMEDVLDVYEKPYDPDIPQICFDERPCQLIGENHIPIPAEPGQPERYDYEYIREVLDNLNTHTPAALYQAFSPEEVRRILSKLEFHYTPKHGSWLNMVEIELSV